MSQIPAPPAFAPGWLSVCRGASLGLGFLLLLNAMERRVFNMQDSSSWLCSLAPLDSRMVLGLLAMAGTALVLFAVRPALPTPIRWTLLLILAALIMFISAGLVRVFLNGSSPVDVVLFQPLSQLIALTLVTVGVAAPSSRLPVARPPIATIPVVAVITILGIVVSTVRSGIRADAIRQSNQPVVIALMLDDAGEFDRTEWAIEVGKSHADVLVTVISADQVTLAAQVESIKTRMTELGQSPDRVRPLLAGANIADTLHSLSLLSSTPDDTKELPDVADQTAVEDGNQNMASQNQLVWLGQPAQFARVRMLSRRVGAQVTCSARKDELNAATGAQPIAIESVALLTALCSPLTQLAR